MGCIFCESDPSLVFAVLAFWSGLVLFSAYRSLQKCVRWYRRRRGNDISKKPCTLAGTSPTVAAPDAPADLSASRD
jgi:hypothetical protein